MRLNKTKEEKLKFLEEYFKLCRKHDLCISECYMRRPPYTVSNLDDEERKNIKILINEQKEST